MNCRDEVGRTPLWYAVSQDGNVEALRMLIDAGANVDIDDKREKRTPLHVCADHRYVLTGLYVQIIVIIFV